MLYLANGNEEYASILKTRNNFNINVNGCPFERTTLQAATLPLSSSVVNYCAKKIFYQSTLKNLFAVLSNVFIGESEQINTVHAYILSPTWKVNAEMVNVNFFYFVTLLIF